MSVCTRWSTAALGRSPARCEVAMLMFDEAVIVVCVAVEVVLDVVEDLSVTRLDGDREQDSPLSLS